MPFNNGIGMHDAKWRSSFGGAIYKTSGSHGCINLPPSVAKTIFDNISAGTPVICYNLPGTEKSTTSGTAKPAETKPGRDHGASGNTSSGRDAGASTGRNTGTGSGTDHSADAGGDESAGDCGTDPGRTGRSFGG